MSITVNNLSYTHPDREVLFSGITFSVLSNGRTSLTGNNGTGKSTILKIIAGALPKTGGDISLTGSLCYVPQHSGQYNDITVAEALGIAEKISALDSILAGAGTEEDYNILNEDWDIEDRIAAAFRDWDLKEITVSEKMKNLSGGEKTKIFLAGISLLRPDIIVMDEPTNYLDRKTRKKLYRTIEDSHATILVVSHDRELLNLMDVTLKLTHQGINRYGGNYDFYKTIKDSERQALMDSIAEKEKSLRAARRTASEVLERKLKRDSRGDRKQRQEGVPRIMLKTIKDGAEKSCGNLRDNHTERIETAASEARELRSKLPPSHEMKIKLERSDIHKGKLLVFAKDINISYESEKPLWKNPLSVKIFSGDRIHISGDNGSGKSTLLRIITGELEPQCGTVERGTSSFIYVDQEYSFIDSSCTVIGQLEKFNTGDRPDHIVKTELHRFLFSETT